MEDFFGILLLLLIIFAYCCYLAEKDRQKEKAEQRERERQLLRDAELHYAKNEAVAETNRAFIGMAKQTLANWKPIQWPEDVIEQIDRKPRKWGRHG